MKYWTTYTEGQSIKVNEDMHPYIEDCILNLPYKRLANDVRAVTYDFLVEADSEEEAIEKTDDIVYEMIEGEIIPDFSDVRCKEAIELVAGTLNGKINGNKIIIDEYTKLVYGKKKVKLKVTYSGESVYSMPYSWIANEYELIKWVAMCFDEEFERRHWAAYDKIKV